MRPRDVTKHRTACEKWKSRVLTFASGRDIISDVGERKFTSAQSHESGVLCAALVYSGREHTAS